MIFLPDSQHNDIYQELWSMDQVDIWVDRLVL